VFLERSMSPDTGVSYLLPRVIGYSRAADLIFTSRSVGAEEAYRLGLLDRLVSDDGLVAAAIALAEEMAKWPPMALRSAKRVTLRNLDADLKQSLRNEIASLVVARRAPHDVAESLASFRERRSPHFTGE
jgi:2-(1,2-epoxy-1,2-dihydrophenyl)acetyl-CoA isomerase